MEVTLNKLYIHHQSIVAIKVFMNCFLIQIKCGQKRKSCIDIQFAHLKLTDGAGIGIGIGTNCRMTQNSLVTADPE